MKKNTLVIVAVCVAGILSGCTEPTSKKAVIKKVKAMEIGSISALQQRAFPGKAQAAEEASVSFRVSGQLEKRFVNVGDRVEKGQLLAELDKTDFENSVLVAEGAVAETEAAHIEAKRNYQRALDIQKTDPGVISKTMIDRANANEAITRAAFKSAGASLKLVQDRLNYASLKAPFSGEIVASYVEAHEPIVAKQNILRLVNPDSMEFKFDVPESLIGLANDVTQASVIFDVNPSIEFEAIVEEVGREASHGTRTYPVTLTINKSERFSVLSGMAGKAYVKAVVNSKDDNAGIKVPATALFSRGDIKDSYVWKIIDNKVVKHKVTVSELSDYGVVVSKGLNKGDVIVIAGVNSLVEDQTISILPFNDNKGE